MRIIINVMSDDLEKSKAFVRYLMNLDNNNKFKIKDTKYELIVECENIICKTVKCTENYRGNKYHKLYVDNQSVLDEDVFYNTFKFNNVALRLPNGVRGLYFADQIEYISFNDYIK